MIAGYRYDSKDMIAPFEYKGYTDLNLFIGWFKQMLCPELKEGDCVVLDNASFHKSVELEEIADEFKIKLIYLPAYSPDLNPIEKCWANFKRKLRKIIKKSKNFQEAITMAFNQAFSE